MIMIQEFDSPGDLQSWMAWNIKYCGFKGLKTHDDVLASGCGSCHDQVMFELEELRKMGLKPKAEFFIEYNPEDSSGGTTHSFVYFQESGATYWFENAWMGRQGVERFSSLRAIKAEVERDHKVGIVGDPKKFPNLAWGEFKEERHTPGESLNQLVEICLDI